MYKAAYFRRKSMPPILLGTLILRAQIERHLPEQFTTPTQLHRWEHSVTALLRDGAFRH